MSSKETKTRAGQWLARFYLDNNTNRSEFASERGLSQSSLRAMEYGIMQWKYDYIVAISAKLTQGEADAFADAITCDERDVNNAKLAMSHAKLAELLAPLRGKSDGS